MLARLSIPLLALALLAGCAAPAVRAPVPEPVPAAWSARVEPASTVVTPAPAWWMALADAELDRLVTMALRENADVAVAAARVRQARGLARETRADRLPRLEASDAAARERVPQVQLRDADGRVETIPPFRQSRYATQLEARYEIDLLARLALAERAASADAAASAAELRAVRQWLAREVVLAYAELRLVDERAAFARAANERLATLLELEQRRLDAGVVTRERVRVAERALADRQDLQAALAHERHAALTRLGELLDAAAGEIHLQARDDYYARLALSGAMAPDLPAAVLARRADVAAAWQRVLAASDRAERTRLERYPALTLTGSAGFVSEATRRWLSGDALAWVAQAAVQGPLFDGGRNAARLEQSRALVAELHAQHRVVVVRALAEVETALSATRSATERVALAAAETERRDADRAATANARSAGIGGRPALLQSELEHIAAQETLSARRYELLVAWADAHKAVGW